VVYGKRSLLLDRRVRRKVYYILVSFQTKNARLKETYTRVSVEVRTARPLSHVAQHVVMWIFLQNRVMGITMLLCAWLKSRPHWRRS